MAVPTPPARLPPEGYMAAVIAAAIVFGDNGTSKIIGTIPAGAIVIGGGARVTEAFNDSGTDTLIIGVTADDDDLATLLDMSAVGLIVADELATSGDSWSATADLTFYAKYVGQNSNATTGRAVVYIEYFAKVG